MIKINRRTIVEKAKQVGWLAVITGVFWWAGCKPIEAASVTVTTGSSGNDSYVSSDTFTATDTQDFLGEKYNNAATDYLVFENVQIAQGTTINSATISLVVTNAGGNNVNVTINGENTANATAPTSLSDTQTIDGRLTSQSVSWNSVTGTDYGTVITSPDITTIIQAIINRSDWVKGNSILIRMGNNNSDGWSQKTYATADYNGLEPPSLTINYTPVNHAPIAVDDSYSTNTTMTFDLMANDSDPDGDTITITAVNTPSHGAASISNNKISYTPTSGYAGADSFTYTISDGSLTDSATVSVTVLANPIYYTYSFTANRDSVPSLYYKNLSYVVQVGTVTSVSVKVDGSSVSSNYDSSSGRVSFTTTGTNVVVTVKNPATTSGFAAAKAALLDNKAFAWSHGMDDNTYLKNQVALMQAKSWRGSLYLIGNKVDQTRNEDWIVDKPYLVTLFNAGWNLGNHTYTHECYIDKTADQVAADDIRGEILDGYNVVKDITNSSNFASKNVMGFAAPCYSSLYNPYIAAMRSSSETQVMYNETQGSGVMRVDAAGSDYSNSGTTATVIDATTVNFGRNTNIESDPTGVNSTFDWMASNASAARHFWMNTLTHGNKESNLTTVIDHVYSAYGGGGNNTMWVAPSDEVYSYLLTRDNTTLSTPVLTQVGDGSGVTISSVSVTPGNSTADFGWHSNKNGSSQIIYGTSDQLGLTSAETDTSTRVADHAVSLSGLQSCSKYYYQVKSVDQYEAQGTSEAGSFMTGGCANNAVVINSVTAQITTAGGSVNINNGTGYAGLTIPNGFAAATEDFQIIQLNKATTLALTGNPSGYSSSGDTVIQLRAFDAAGNMVSDFSKALTVTLKYADGSMSGLDLASLAIFRWDGSAWHELTGCSTNTTNQTVTCSTSQFSIFGVFASPLAPTPTSSPTPGNTTTNSSGSTSTAQAPGCGEPKPGGKAPWLYGAIPKNGNEIEIYFTENDDPVSYYAVEYGLAAGKYIYAAQNIGGRGSRTYTVRFLTPNTEYYFRVRAGNGCATGEWSNEISAKTPGAISYNQLEISQSAIESSPSETNSCQTYTVKSGDTLWKIAANLLGSGSQYNLIANQNASEYPSLVTSDSLEIGWELKINCGAESPLSEPGTGLDQTYQLTVKVVDTDNKPIEKAKVIIDGGNEGVSTDKNGIVTLDNLTGGQHKITVSYQNYQGEESINLDNPDREVTIQLKIKQQKITASAYVKYGLMAGLILITAGVLFARSRRHESS